MTKTMNREQRVAEFISYAKPPTEELAWKCFYEEVSELDEAGTEYKKNPTLENRAAFIKEWADVQYVLSQLAVYYNFDGTAAFNRVADNNLTKVIDGKVRYRESDGKVLKPDNYVKPDMSGL